MKHKGFADMRCPIAHGLEHVGEWWSILILRDALKGMTRFDEFQKSLGIAPNMLTRRLGTLVDSRLLERRLYSEKPPRYEYVLTERGRDFRPVLWALLTWGNKHFPPDGETSVVVESATGVPAEPLFIDARTGRPLRAPDFKVIRVPVADGGRGRESDSEGESRPKSLRAPARATKRPNAKRKKASTSS
jgi:DNA-binding HxlR family transcriptional regulator